MPGAPVIFKRGSQVFSRGVMRSSSCFNLPLCGNRTKTIFPPRDRIFSTAAVMSEKRFWIASFICAKKTFFGIYVGGGGGVKSGIQICWIFFANLLPGSAHFSHIRV